MLSDCERRIYQRHYARRLGVVVDGRYYPIIDISLGGASFQGAGFPTDVVVPARIASLSSLQQGYAVILSRVSAGASRVRAEFMLINAQLVNDIFRGLLLQAPGNI